MLRVLVFCEAGNVLLVLDNCSAGLGGVEFTGLGLKGVANLVSAVGTSL